MAAEALGLIGAIDPSRLMKAQPITDLESRVHTSHSSVGFVKDLVSELARAFLAATDSNIQMCASFALQEMLRVHNIENPSQKEGGCEVWQALPPHVQDLLLPLYNSKYVISGADAPRSTTALHADWLPVFGTKEANTFKSWITNWMTKLLHIVENDNDYAMFSVCKSIFRRDINTALHILPPLVMSILLQSPQHHAKIATEVLAVLKGTKRNDNFSLAELNISDSSAQSLEMLEVTPPSPGSSMSDRELE